MVGVDHALTSARKMTVSGSIHFGLSLPIITSHIENPSGGGGKNFQVFPQLTQIAWHPFNAVIFLIKIARIS